MVALLSSGSLVRYAKHLLDPAWVLILVWMLAVALPSAGQASATTVAVTVTDSNVRFSRTALRIGAVVFNVTNRGKRRHEFRIAGRTTALLFPGRSATLTILFTQAGRYPYLVPGLPKGVLRVTAPAAAAATATPASTVAVAPCTNPMTSTVTVTMTDAPAPRGYAFAPSAIPCGTVTFIVKDVGSAPHGLQLMDPSDVLLPPSTTVEPAQTTTMVSKLMYVGSYQWIDSVTSDWGEAEVGFLAVH